MYSVITAQTKIVQDQECLVYLLEGCGELSSRVQASWPGEWVHRGGGGEILGAALLCGREAWSMQCLS